jgi:DNA-binding HxlR family transcriptional regulator
MPTDARQLCPRFEAAMKLLSRPWNGLLISALTEGPHRFGELSERLAPIGDRILSQRLKELERLHLIERRVLPGPPVRVEYSLSESGRGFSAVEDAIRAWGEKVGAAMLAADQKPKVKPARAKRALAR